MLGSILKDEEKTSEILKQLKSFGYEGLELNGFMIHHSPLMVRLLTKAYGMPTGRSGDMDWLKLMKDANMSVISLHSDLDSLEKKSQEIIAEARKFNTSYIVITGMYNYDYSNEEKVKELSERLNACGKILKDNDLKLLYHNHNVELLNTESGKKAYEILIEETDPEYVNFEFDSYWFTEAGGDAKAWMKRLGKRMKLWHVSDRGSRIKKKALTPIISSDPVELGTGNLDLDGMKQIAMENETEAMIVEIHKNFLDNDPLKTLNLSSRWLNKKDESDHC